jgi:hypothetical protein
LKEYHDHIQKAVAGKDAVVNSRKLHRRLKAMQNDFKTPIPTAPILISPHALPMQPWQYSMQPQSFVPLLPLSPFGSTVSQFQLTMSELPPTSTAKKRKMHCTHCGKRKTRENNHLRTFCPNKSSLIVYIVFPLIRLYFTINVCGCVLLHKIYE